MLLKSKINEWDVKNVLEIEFLEAPEAFDFSSFKGFIIAYTSVNLPIVTIGLSVYILHPKENNQWEKYLIALNSEELSAILNLFVKTFSGYDFKTGKGKYDQTKKIIIEILDKILVLSPNNDLQYWGDTLGNLLGNWDYIEQAKMLLKK